MKAEPPPAEMSSAFPRSRDRKYLPLEGRLARVPADLLEQLMVPAAGPVSLPSFSWIHHNQTYTPAFYTHKVLGISTPRWQKRLILQNYLLNKVKQIKKAQHCCEWVVPGTNDTMKSDPGRLSNRSASLKVNQTPKHCELVYKTLSQDFTTSESYRKNNYSTFRQVDHKWSARNYMYLIGHYSISRATNRGRKYSSKVYWVLAKERKGPGVIKRKNKC